MAERVVALVMLVVSGIYLSQSLRMPVGSTARPGPAFYPLAVAVFACVVAVVVVGIAFRRPRATEPAGGGAEHVARLHVGLTVATLAAFCLLLPWTGYPLAALLFVSTQLRQLGAGWGRALLAGLVSAEGSYYLFAILLGVTLPRGLWPH